MGYTKVELSENILALRDDDNKYLYMSTENNSARILYSEEDADLFEYAENEAILSGKNVITYDFCDEYEETAAFLKGIGYEIEKGPAILAVNTQELFASKAVKKSLTISFPDAKYVPFRELVLSQLMELGDFIKANGIPIRKEDITTFDEDLSGIVYDKEENVKSFILVTPQGGDLIIECLFGINKNDPRFIMSALQGFGNEMVFSDIIDVYDRIVMLEMNKTIRPLLKRLLDKDYDLTEIGTVLLSKKEIKKEIADTEEGVKEDSTFVKKSAGLDLENHISQRSYQRNINWKAIWNLSRL